MRSPFLAIAEYERSLGLPVNYLNCSMCVEASADILCDIEHCSIFEFKELAVGHKALGRNLNVVKSN